MATNFIETVVEHDIVNGLREEITTRFPPEPNGYLHIGHAKSLCINFGIKDKYNGKCNLRFDDTNPTKEDVEYVDSIKEDIRWLGFEWDKECFASDYFEQTYEYAVLLIKKGLAYVCDYSAEEIRQTRGTLTESGTESPWRNRSVEENLILFKEMREGKYPDGSKTLRAKIDMAASNMNMRDPVIYRILRAHHHRTGNNWLIYPMYDFAHPIGDAIEGVTHSICTLEFEDHRPLYDWVVENCEFSKPPHQYEFARLNIKNTIMSKRYLKKLVDSGAVDGWDDPRMPTLSGMRKRGFPAEAIKNFCAAVGVAKANSEVDGALLEHYVRDYLNIHADRAMVVEKPLKVIIENFDDTQSVELINNPNDTSRGVHKAPLGREIYIEESDFAVNPPPKYHRLVPGGMVRLKGAYILKYLSHEFDGEGKMYLRCEAIPDSMQGGVNAGIKVKGVVQWVDVKNAVPVVLHKYSGLLTDESEESKNFDDRLNPNSLETVYGGVAEPFLREGKVGDAFQFMRSAYYKKAADCEGALVFYRIVELKDSFNRQ